MNENIELRYIDGEIDGNPSSEILKRTEKGEKDNEKGW